MIPAGAPKGHETKPFAFAGWLRAGAFWLLIAALAWAPFPLGSAVSWGAPLLELMIASSWVLWAISTVGDTPEDTARLRPIAAPAAIALIVLAWTVVQTLPIVPENWAHPIWAMTAHSLGRPIRGVVSIDPWRTHAETLKLVSYAAAFWLAFVMARRSEMAKTLLNAIVAIAALYAAYGFVLAILDIAQAGLIYAIPFQRSFISGPFMLHNSFATFEGLGTLAAILRLFDLGRENVVTHRGLRPLFHSALQFSFGRGAPTLIAALLSFSAVIASASRAGFVATATALLAMAIVAAFLARRSQVRGWTAAAAIASLVAIFTVIMLNGDTLGDRLARLADAGEADQIRLALWDATWRMIGDAPWRGLGLGTFQDAYPLYARQALPFVMDKAHCDYLEFAAGVGLPAGIAWWTALVWLAILCARGVFARRRNRHFALLGFCATILVAVHSAVDFSLQLPAVGTFYAAMLGLGVAQAQRSRAQPGASPA
ncbi:MAG: O-antigen ligase family protein [Rhizomicrobium sp.]